MCLNPRFVGEVGLWGAGLNLSLAAAPAVSPLACDAHALRVCLGRGHVSELSYLAGLSNDVVWVPLRHTQLFDCTGTQPLLVLCASIFFLNTKLINSMCYFLQCYLDTPRTPRMGKRRRKTGVVVVVLLFQGEESAATSCEVGWFMCSATGLEVQVSLFTTHARMLICRWPSAMVQVYSPLSQWRASGTAAG